MQSVASLTCFQFTELAACVLWNQIHISNVLQRCKTYCKQTPVEEFLASFADVPLVPCQVAYWWCNLSHWLKRILGNWYLVKIHYPLIITGGHSSHCCAWDRFTGRTTKKHLNVDGGGMKKEQTAKWGYKGEYSWTCVQILNRLNLFLNWLLKNKIDTLKQWHNTRISYSILDHKQFNCALLHYLVRSCDQRK